MWSKASHQVYCFGDVLGGTLVQVNTRLPMASSRLPFELQRDHSWQLPLLGLGAPSRRGQAVYRGQFPPGLSLGQVSKRFKASRDLPPLACYLLGSTSERATGGICVA